jgi:DNA-binding response OmpR family regulator
MAKTILVIEDEERIAHWVCTYFGQAGFRTLHAHDGRLGLDLALSQQPDLVILDLMLPEMDGVTVCRALRRESDVPIIMLTARGQERDRLQGFELGADDYVVKPFSPSELVARARAVLRRVGDDQQVEVLRGGDIELDMAAHTCTVSGKEVKLSRIQFDLLRTLMLHAGQALSRQQLLDAVFDEDYDGFDRTIDVHIRRLRQRVEHDPADVRHVTTVFGVGYRFVA